MSAQGASGRVRSPSAILHRAVPALIGIVVVAVLGAAALAIGRWNLEAAQNDRLANRMHAVASISRNMVEVIAPEARARSAKSSPFTPEGTALDELLLKQYKTSDAIEAFVGLVSVDGRTLAAVPSSDTLDVTDMGTAWSKAVAGEPALSDVFRHHGGVVNAALIPIGSPQPWGVVVIAVPASTSNDQAFHEQIGSLNGEPGGLVLLDRRGVAANSWSRDELGRPVLAPADVAGLPQGSVKVWTAAPTGRDTTYLGTSVGQGYGLVFEQETDKLYGDLQAAQKQRNLALLGVLGTALAALVAFGLAREVNARRAETRVHSLLKNSQDLVLVARADGSLAFVSPALDGLLRISPDVWTGRLLTDCCHPDDADRFRHLLDQPASGPLLNVRLGEPSSGYGWFDVEASDLSTHPEVGGVLLTCHGIEQRKLLEDELTHQATHDRLTGLPNRAEFSHRLEGLVRDERPVRPFALLYLDLDQFKPVNDTLGHDAGDEVLTAVADRLRHTAGPDAFVCRLGGDEFGVLLDGADRRRAVATAEDLLGAARSPVAVGARLVHLDASIGIALADPETVVRNVEHLVRRADEAMYRAKQSGRGRYAFADAPPRCSTPPPVRVVAEAAPPAPGACEDRRDAAPATPPPSGTGRADRGRRTALLPILLATGLVVAIAALGIRQTTDGRRDAEAEQLRNQYAYTARAAAFFSKQYDATRLTTVASNAPWTFDGSAVDQKVVGAFSRAREVGPEAVAILATPEGRVLASDPPGATLTVPTTAPIWQEALKGKGNQLSRVDDPDQPRSYFLLPVVHDRRTVAVVALGVSIRHGGGQIALEKAGSSVSGSGGWSLADSQGVIYMSYSPDLLGTRIAEPGQLAGLASGSVRDLSTEQGIVTVSPMTSTFDPTYLVYSMPTTDFYNDLRMGQWQRDLSFVAVAAAAVAGLALVNHRREQAVRRSEARLDALVQHAHDVVAVVDDLGRSTFVSSAIVQLLGYTPDERTGQQLLDLVHPEDRSRVVTGLTEARSAGAAAITDVRLLRTAGDYRWFDLDAVDLTSQPEVHGLLLTCHDVTERRELQEQLAYRALHDPLTGLPNRATLAHRMAQLASANDAGPFAVLFIDLDHFKPVNDSLGHDVGDEVLRTIAQRFLINVRVDAGDGSGDVVCRLGGDEFAVVLRNVTEPIARATADRLIAAAREPVTVGSHTVRIGATIGISLSHPAQEDPDLTMRRADQAMYRAKEAGRGTYAIFEADVLR